MLRELQETNAALRDVRELLRQQVRAGRRVLEPGAEGPGGGGRGARGLEEAGLGAGGWAVGAARGRRREKGVPVGRRERGGRRRRKTEPRWPHAVPSAHQVKEITFLKNTVMECDACGERT